MAEVVYTGLDGNTAVAGTLFQGQKIWFSTRVPSLQRFINDVKSNGGEVVKLEKNADIKIVDYLRKEVLPGTHSWKYIEQSVQKGVLENLDDHRVGPPIGTVRGVGSSIQPSKGSRTPFTAEDDRILSEWVHAFEESKRVTGGNEIYKQLEAENPRHPWQSWRDRYIKYVKDRPRSAQVPSNAPPTPPLDQNAGQSTISKERAGKIQTKHVPASFTDEDGKALLNVAVDLMNIVPDKIVDAWNTWAAENPEHSAQEWRSYWENTIRPIHLRTEIEESAPGLKPKKLPDMSSSHESATQRSPSFHLKSPRLASSNSPTHRRLSLIADDVSHHSDDAQSTRSVGSSIKSPPLKRKRSTYEPEITEIPSSSPLQDKPRRSNKSPYSPQFHLVQEEILSSAEITPTTNKKVSSIPFGASIIDLESEETDSREGNRASHIELGSQDEHLEESDEEIGRLASQSLSEPDHHQKNLGIKIEGYEQAVNLNIPSPEGGWNSDNNESATDDIDDDDTVIPRGQPFQDTQAILRASTPQLDFTIADPPEGWDALLPSTSPHHHRSISQTLLSSDDNNNNNNDNDPNILSVPSNPSSPESTQSARNAYIESWIDTKLALGASIENIGIALKTTNMNFDNAEMVLERLERGEGLPQRTRGVWTESDDRDLGAVDARVLERLWRKHGEEAMGRREAFLRAYEEGG